MKKSILSYSNCFVCGDKNDSGLNIQFVSETGKAKAEFKPGRNFEGYQGILHGGILSTVLDEVMIKAVLAQGIMAVTARMEIKFKKPARIGEKLHLEGWIKVDKEKMILTEGKVTRPDGSLIAEGKGTYFRVKDEFKEQLIQGLD